MANNDTGYRFGMPGEDRRQTTVLDPSALTTQRHGRTGHDQFHPYGKDIVEADVDPASSTVYPWRQPSGHRTVRDDA